MTQFRCTSSILFGFLFLVTSCGSGMADYPTELGSGYYLHDNGYIFKGEKVEFGHRIIDSYANPLNDYANNKDFILAEEIYTRPWYWIIDKKKDTIYGPTDFETYLEKKEEFGLKRLKLRCERSAETQKFLKLIYGS